MKQPAADEFKHPPYADEFLAAFDCRDKYPRVTLSMEHQPGPDEADCGPRPPEGTAVRWSGRRVPEVGQEVMIYVLGTLQRLTVTAFVVCEDWLGFVVDDQDPATAGLWFGVDIQRGPYAPGAPDEIEDEHPKPRPKKGKKKAKKAPNQMSLF